MRALLVVGFVVVLTMSVRADSVLIPLVDQDDPIQILRARMEFDEDVRPMMVIELENRTASRIETADIWLNSTRFYTKSEIGNQRKLWDCGLVASAARGMPSQAIAPSERVVLRLPMNLSCDNNRAHEHFFLDVTRITSGPPDNRTTVWQREPGEFSRLLNAAMPHP